MATMLGWLRRPAALASRWNRTSISSASAPSSWSRRMVLSATVRSIDGSNASYTTPIAPRPSSRRISYLPILTGAGSLIAGRSRADLLVLVVDFPHGLLDQALHHGVERHAALLRRGDPENRCRGGAHFHFFLGIALCHLLGGFRIHDLVAHADDPDAARVLGPDRAHRGAARGGAARAAEYAQHAAERASVETLLCRCDLLGLQDVELDDPLGRLELAAAEHLARLVRIAEVVSKGEFVEQGAEIGALEHLEIGIGELDLR